MSSFHSEIMLKTLLQFEGSEITLTFTNENQIAILDVCYKKKCFQLTYLNSQTIETYENIESALSAINKAMQSSLREPLII